MAETSRITKREHKVHFLGNDITIPKGTLVLAEALGETSTRVTIAYGADETQMRLELPNDVLIEREYRYWVTQTPAVKPDKAPTGSREMVIRHFQSLVKQAVDDVEFISAKRTFNGNLYFIVEMSDGYYYYCAEEVQQ